MKHKEIKAEMLKNGSYSRIRKLDKGLYKETEMSLNKQLNAYMHGEYYDMIDIVGTDTVKKMALEDVAMAHELDSKELECYFQMKRAKHKQMTRMRNHIEFYINSDKYDLIFATFTFSEESLNLKSETRRKKLLECLRNCDLIDDYICNIDYGKENEREHYHGILFVKKGAIDYQFKKTGRSWYIENMPIDYTMGFTYFEKVGSDKDDNDRVTSYVAKLNMHALKVKQSRLIIKRDSPYNYFLSHTKVLFEK